MKRFSVFLLLVLSAGGIQTSAAQIHGNLNLHAGFEPWPHYSKNIQHRLLGGLGLSFQNQSAELSGYIDWIWWGRREFVRVTGSPFNAESGKFQERRHGLRLFHKVTKNIKFGLSYDRRAIIQFDREEDWPDSDDALTQLKLGPPWPSIGYHDGIRIALVWRDSTSSIEVFSPAWRFHDNTLPWPSWVLHLQHDLNRISLEAHGQAGGLRPWSFDFEGSFRLGEFTRFGIRAGRLPYPGYRGTVDRVALVISADVTDELF